MAIAKSKDALDRTEAQFRKWEQAAREGADVKTVRLNSLRLAKVAAAETVAASSQAIAPYDRKPRSLSRGAAAVRTCKLDQVCDQLRIKLHGIDHRPQRRQPRIT